MYRIEIFDEKMDFVSACYTDDAQTIAIDYLAYDPFQIAVQAIEAKKGYFAHITGKNNELVADCVIADVQPDKEQQELSLRPLQALFDVGVFYSPVSDAITWLGNNLTDQFVTNADTLQRRPLNITATAGSRSFPLTGYNLNPTINILSVITNAFATWGIVTEAFLDLSAKEIVVNIFEQVAEQTIECDLDNIISAEITLGDSYGSTNKLTIRKTVEEGTPTGTTEVTYYRHTDGSINTTDDDRIVPVFWEVATIEQTSDMTDAQWIQETFTKAKEVLSVGHYDNEVILSVWEDDKIINPRSIEIGTIVTLLLKGETYYSILTGYQVEGSIITLTFGAVRTELTKKLSIQNRGSSSSSSSSGGGGGGGGGAVTGVKGNEEILYRVGDVNLTPADIGAVPTTTTINGHVLSSDVTITKADVGLGNVDNTADLDKPISDAVQSALDDKVDKETGKGLSTNDFTDALLTKLNGIESGAQVNTITGVKGNAESSYRTGNVNLTKANIGLGNVENTSDANKPISTATQTALDGKVNTTDIATTSNLGLVMPDGTSITIDADGTIHSVGGGGGGGSSSPSRVLLWTNPSTSTPFPAQNVLSASQISAYTSFEIEVRNYISENIYNICKITKDSPRQLWVFDTSTMGANSGIPAITNRLVTIDSNGLSFATGYSKTTTNSGSAGATDTVCIPCRIWGIVDSGGTSSITYFESQTTSVASNAEILRITDSAITTNTIVLECTFANPSAISGDVSWTSYNGYISFVGTCTSATTANVTLSGTSSGGEITFTKTSTVTTVNSFKARVVDGFIIISYAFRVASVTSGTWVTLGTLSQAPSARGARQNAVRTYNGTYAGMTVLETDGRFMFYPTQSFTNTDLEGSYICIL